MFEDVIELFPKEAEISKNLLDAFELVPDISICRFSNATKCLREISVNGGDEDWIAIFKESLANTYYIPFIEDGGRGSIGSCCVDYFRVSEYIIAIGSH